jgi:hypothetical protein
MPENPACPLISAHPNGSPAGCANARAHWRGYEVLPFDATKLPAMAVHLDAKTPLGDSELTLDSF